jgi:glycerol-3-phosphate acyltransferase PlsY
MSILFTLLKLLPFYLLGAFPTGVLISRAHGVDISTQGSGNVGATNVARVIGKRAGILTLVGDIFKGVIGVVIASLVSDAQWFPAAVGIALVLGHCFSIPPLLRGGKGVATSIGVVAALSFHCAAVAIITFGAVFSFSRIVSLASITAALVVPLAAFLLNFNEATTVAFTTIALVVVARHEENIRRLIEGREPRFSASK